MTTRTLPTPPRAPDAPPRPALYAGLLAAGWAAGAGLVAVAVPVLLVWMADARSGADAGAALRAAGLVWLAAHAVDLRLPGGTLGLAPLGLLAVPLLLLARAGGHLARQVPVSRLPEAARLAVSVAAPYSLLASLVAALSSTAGAGAAGGQALLAGFLVGGAGALVGLLRAAGLGRAAWAGVPDRLARLLRSGGAAVLLLAAGGALLAGGSLAAHAGRAADLTGASSPGLVGGVALLAVGVALVPTVTVWGLAWLAGPGFAVGAGTAVTPFAVHLGPVPAVPLLAALPPALPPGAGWLVLLAPLAAGAVAGRLVLAGAPVRTGWRAAGEAALAGPVAGVLAAVLAWLAAGPAGSARLAVVGPSPWRVGLAVAAEVAVGAAATAACAAWWRGRVAAR